MSGRAVPWVSLLLSVSLSSCLSPFIKKEGEKDGQEGLTEQDRQQVVVIALVAKGKKGEKQCAQCV